MIIGSLLTRVRSLFASSHAAGAPMVLGIVLDPSSDVDPAVFSRIVRALAVQAQRDVAPEYGLPPPIIVEMRHGDPRPAPAAPGGLVAVISCVPLIPGDPADAGWHQPLGVGEMFDGFVSTEGVQPDALSEVMSHEIGETIVDPMCNRTATDRDGVIHPVEVFDPAQARDDGQRLPYVIDGVTVWLSNFVLENFWSTETAPSSVVDFKSRLEGKTGADRYVPGPFTRGPWGYESLTYPDGSNRNVFGDRHCGALSARQQHADSRIQQRMRKAAR